MSGPPPGRGSIGTLFTKWAHDLFPGREHTKHHVAIVGAGMGGLVAARILQKNGHKAVVFEREQAPTARLQGGTLDMHPESGQVALELAGLTKEFLALARPEGEEMYIVDKTGTVLFADDGVRGPPPAAEGGGGGPPAGQGPPSSPEIDRGHLRQILLDSLEPGTVQWNSQVQSAELVEGDKKVRVVFDPTSPAASVHGSTLFDALIGADGTWSHIRPLLSPVKPNYAGVTSVEVNLHNVDADFPELAKMVGQGTYFALADNKGLIAQRNSGGTVRIYAMLRAPLSWTQDTGLATMGPTEAIAYLLEHHYADWAPSLRALLNPACSPAATPLPARPLFQLPTPHSWETYKGGRITLVGDAAHVMVPFAGEGANLAMLDGAEAALAIASSRDGAMLKAHINEFEQVMMDRAGKAAIESLGNLDLFVSEDGARKAAEMFKQMFASFGPPGSGPPQDAMN